MKVLVLDCAFSQTVAVVIDNKLRICNVNPNEKHSDNFMMLIDKTLKEVNLTINDIDVFAINIGPGSFTGLRVAVSIVKGFCFSENKKVLSFTTFDYIDSKNNILVPGFSTFVYKKKLEDMSCEDINLLEKSAKYDVFDLNLYEKLKNDGFCVNYKEKKDYCNILKKRLDYININELEPMYLRKSQAEIDNEKKRKV